MSSAGVVNMWCRFFAHEILPGTYTAFFSRTVDDYSSGEEDGEDMLKLVQY